MQEQWTKVSLFPFGFDGTSSKAFCSTAIAASLSPGFPLGRCLGRLAGPFSCEHKIIQEHHLLISSQLHCL